MKKRGPTIEDLLRSQGFAWAGPEVGINFFGYLPGRSGDAKHLHRGARVEKSCKVLHRKFACSLNYLDVLFEQRSANVMIEIPRIAFSQALTNLLENAREAQHANGNNSPIRVTVERVGEKCIIQIIDRGIGLPSTKEQVGEPFFTTKHSGTGLGVYVARAVAQGAGGGLGYDTSTDDTTIARWWFPASSPRRNLHVVHSQTDS